MKKGLLLSVIASSFVFAGGVVVPPPAEPVPAMWTFGGQLVGYYQTQDQWGTGDLFTPQDTTVVGNEGVANADVGIQLRTNGNLGYGFGVGLELSGLTTLGLENDPAAQYGAIQLPSNPAQTAPVGDISGTGGWISQAYLTYVMDNTTVKVGRQELPKALSPFAFSEAWAVFKNTFEGAVIINGDLPDTTLVAAYVTRSNAIAGPMDEFNELNPDNDVMMLTAQNKSIEGLTLTGTIYYAPEMVATEDVMILWADAAYTMGDYYVAVQGGTVTGDGLPVETTGFGGKIGGTFGMFGAEVAYSTVDEGTVAIHNLGTGVKTPLYTQMILNQGFIKSDADTIVARVSADTEYGKFAIAYDMTTYNVFTGADNEYTELDVTYSTKIGESTELFAAYVMQTDDGAGAKAFGAPTATDDTQSTVRVWAKYNF
jgi:hypothetical protein